MILFVLGAPGKQVWTPETREPRDQAGLYYRVGRVRTPGLLGYDVGCAWTFLALLDIEGHGLPFSQRLESAALEGAVVNEDVFGAI